MAKQYPDLNLRFMIGDVKNKERMHQLLEGVDHVIHAAAMKQIDTCEYNPTECIATNINGTINVITACIENNVKKMVTVSTDKAVSPVNLYGSTKLTAEKLTFAANSFNKTKFRVVRYGNVLNSRGSFVEKILECKKAGRPVPITNKTMTRFWMSKEEAADLVLGALKNGCHMPIIPNARAKKITDLARDYYPDCEFEEIGIRPGEKLHEMLLSEGEIGMCEGREVEGPICSTG